MVSSLRHSFRPCALAIFTSLSGYHLWIWSATALATPPLAAKPRPALEAYTMVSSVSISSRCVKSTPLASNIPASSSKVSTKSTSLRTWRRLASSFLAAQGPTKHIRASGSAFFIMRAVNTMGVMAMEMLLASSGNRVLAIMLQLGQQLVAIKRFLAGTSSKKSLASSTVQRSAPMATSTTSSKPSCCMAARSLAVSFRAGNWFTNAGAIRAYTRSPRLMLWISWKIWPLSEIAPKGQLTRHIPQLTHLE